MPTQYESGAETEGSHSDWKLLLAAVECLHGRGFTGLRAIPHHGPVGYWRFAVAPAANLTGGVSFPPRGDDAVFTVSAGGFPTVGTLRIGPETTVDRVADEILRHLGSAAAVTSADDVAYVEWYSRMRLRAEQVDGRPSAFSDSDSTWRLGDEATDPPPGWVEG